MRRKQRGLTMNGILFWIVIAYGVSMLMMIKSCIGREAFAEDAMFCGGRIIDEGDPEIELFQKCGPPSYSSSCDQDFDLRDSAVRRTCVKTHYYNRGRMKFVKAITVKHGRIIAIDDLDYGH